MQQHSSHQVTDPNLPTPDQRRRASKIDQWVQSIGGNQEQMLQGMADYMTTFKGILDTANTLQMDALCQQYPGFYQFALLLEELAKGIRDGKIQVPQSDK
jgi:hypothetical protein